MSEQHPPSFHTERFYLQSLEDQHTFYRVDLERDCITGGWEYDTVIANSLDHLHSILDELEEGWRPILIYKSRAVYGVVER